MRRKDFQRDLLEADLSANVKFHEVEPLLQKQDLAGAQHMLTGGRIDECLHEDARIAMHVDVWDDSDFPNGHAQGPVLVLYLQGCQRRHSKHSSARPEGILSPTQRFPAAQQHY